MSGPLRITPRAKTVKARAHELRFLSTTARLARSLGRRLVVSVTAKSRIKP